MMMPQGPPKKNGRHTSLALIGIFAVLGFPLSAAQASEIGTERDLSAKTADSATSPDRKFIPRDDGNDSEVMTSDTDYAVERASDWQNQFSALATQVAAQYPSSFAATEVDTDSARVFFVGAPPAGAGDLFKELAQPVTLSGGAELTQVEADAITPIAASRAGEVFTNTSMTTSTNPVTGVVQITVGIADSMPALELVPDLQNDVTEAVTGSQSLKADAPLFDDNRSFAPLGRLNDADDLIIKITFDEDAAVLPDASYGNPGGWKMRQTLNESLYCTSAFVVKDRYSADLGVLTAGHCVGRVSQSHKYYFESRSSAMGPQGDMRWVRSPQMMDAWFHSNYSEGRPVQGYSSPGPGVYTCRFGRKTGQDCGYVLERGTCVRYDGYTYDICGLTTVHELVHRSSMKGDSGGPWFNNNTAYGIHSGHSNNGVRNYFTPVSVALAQFNLNLCFDSNGNPSC